MASWDRRTPAQLATQQQAAIRAQVVDALAPFSPFWRSRLNDLGRSAAQVATPEGLEQLPAVGERDVCRDGNPVGAASLVLQAGEAGYAPQVDGRPRRTALSRRLAAPGSYRSLAEADTRPTSYVWAGQAVRFPVASTRSDLDVVTRAGARLWQVLGLTRADVVVSALAPAGTALVQALSLAALGARSPLVTAEPGGLAHALRMLPATVLIVPAAGAVDLVRELEAAGAPLDGLTTVVVAGAPDDDEREALAGALAAAGARAAVLLAVHVADGHRLAWAECRESAGATGLHTYPDLEVVSLVDAETGERPASPDDGEVVLTQLTMLGSALLRWRTGDLASAVTTDPCPSCGRTVPRVVGTRRGALVPVLALRTGARAVDLRAVAAALTGSSDVADWRVVLGRSARDHADELVVHVTLAAGVDESEAAVAVARGIRSSAGLLPTQVVVTPAGRLPLGSGLTRRLIG